MNPKKCISCTFLFKLTENRSEQNDDFSMKTRNSTYAQFLSLIKDKLEDNERFTEDVELNMREINSYFTKTFFRSDKLKNKSKSKGSDQVLNSKLTALRKTDFDQALEIPNHMKGHPIWKKAIKELENIRSRITPQEKLDCVVKCLMIISRAFHLLVSNFGDEVTADDILQYTCYILLKSNLTNLYSYINYINTFHYFASQERQGMESFCFQNIQIACEYIKLVWCPTYLCLL